MAFALPRVSSKSGVKRGFCLLQVAFWCSHASFATFFVAFMTDTRAVGEMQIGAVLSANLLGGAFGQYAINMLCDRYQNNRVVFIALMALILALYFGIYLSAGFFAASTMYVLLGFVLSAMPSTLDTWIIRSIRDDPGAYGPIRSVACVAYAVVVLALGQLIGRYGYRVTIASACAFIASGIAIAAFMPEIPRSDRGGGRASAERPSMRAIPSVVWALILAAFLWGMANIPVYQMVKLIMNRLGGGVEHMSYAVFASALAEFPLMFFSRRLIGKSPAARLIAASCVYCACTACMLFATSPALIIAMFTLNGSVYGLLLPARRQMIAERVPDGLQNRMHGIADMAGSNFGGFAGNLVGGAALSGFGVAAMLAICSTIHAGSLLGMINVRRLARRGRAESGQPINPL